MKYKVGDEVLVKAKIARVDEIDNALSYEVTTNHLGLIWVAEDEIAKSEHYARGLSDAWELARKIYNTNIADIDKIFGVNGGFYEVMRDFTAEEALAKIDAYEREKEIKVGDVVRVGNNYGVVTWLKNGWASVLWDDGSTHDDYKSKDLTKTGKHIDIEGLLKEIGE